MTGGTWSITTGRLSKLIAIAASNHGPAQAPQLEDLTNGVFKAQESCGSLEQVMLRFRAPGRLTTALPGRKIQAWSKYSNHRPSSMWWAGALNWVPSSNIARQALTYQTAVNVLKDYPLFFIYFCNYDISWLPFRLWRHISMRPNLPGSSFLLQATTTAERKPHTLHILLIKFK